MKKFVPIGIGYAGKEVGEIQKKLSISGSTIDMSKTMTKYTLGMFSAVKAFQKKNGLAATGIVDKKTWDKLMTVKPVRRTRKK